MSYRFWLTAAAALILSASASGAPSGSGVQPVCDRACMTGLLDRYLAALPAASRLPRAQMVNIADSYFEAIEHANGKLAPFADDCVRRENGGQTTHNAKPVPWPVPLGSKAADDAMAYIGTLRCSDQLDTHVMDFITRLYPRRHDIVDEELGIVFSFPMFQHRGGSGTIKVYNVPGVHSLPLGGLDRLPGATVSPTFPPTFRPPSRRPT